MCRNMLNLLNSKIFMLYGVGQKFLTKKYLIGTAETNILIGEVLGGLSRHTDGHQEKICR